jgi:hypothetical protein
VAGAVAAGVLCAVAGAVAAGVLSECSGCWCAAAASAVAGSQCQSACGLLQQVPGCRGAGGGACGGTCGRVCAGLVTDGSWWWYVIGPLLACHAVLSRALAGMLHRRLCRGAQCQRRLPPCKDPQQG